MDSFGAARTHLGGWPDCEGAGQRGEGARTDECQEQQEQHRRSHVPVPPLPPLRRGGKDGHAAAYAGGGDKAGSGAGERLGGGACSSRWSRCKDTMDGEIKSSLTSHNRVSLSACALASPAPA